MKNIIEQLEELRDETCLYKDCRDQKYKCDICEALNEAIAIVKAGRDELNSKLSDVCECAFDVFDIKCHACLTKMDIDEIIGKEGDGD